MCQDEDESSLFTDCSDELQQLQIEKEYMRASHRASQLKLMVVGKRPHSKLSRTEKHGQEPQSSKGALLEDEVSPKRANTTSIKYEKRFSVIEDPRISRFSHAKILLLEKNLMMLTLLILFLGMIQVELEFEGVAANRILLVLDITTIFLLLLIAFRKLAIFQLQVDQRRHYIPRQQRIYSTDYLRLMLKNREYILSLIGQMILAVPHPSIMLTGYRYTLYSEVHQQDLSFSVNDLMGVLMVLKVCLIVRSVVAMSLYSTPRAVRMCHYSGIDHDFMFVIKCLQQQHPLRCSAAVFGICLMVFGYGFRVTEGRLSQLNAMQATGFETFGNCYWTSFITMATLGYGDYIPTTFLSQLLAVTLAVLGMVLNSQLIMALTGYLKMKVSQARSHTVLIRLGEQDGLRKQAAAAFVQSVKVAQLMGKDAMDPLVKRKLKPHFHTLRSSIEVAKSHHKRIKSIVPTQTITEEMTRSFELLKDSFKEIYSMQRKVKRKIEQMQSHDNFKQDEMRRTFISEISNIMIRTKK